ncbi:MAG: hypothetical protein ACE368_14265 [Paracoccaceae bacterium]
MSPPEQIMAESADMACIAQECQVALASLTNVSFTAMNWFGVLLVYGLGLILVASVLNVTKKAREQLDAATDLFLEDGGNESSATPPHVPAE